MRKEAKRHFILWLWRLIQGAVIKQHPIAWMPMIPCVCCSIQIEQNARFCVSCGVYQITEVQQPERETEAIQRLSSPTQQTEELQIDPFETSEMRAVRLAKKGEFLQRYLVEDQLYKWLYTQIEEWYQDAEKLLAESKTYGFQQHVWLHMQLKQRHATGLIEEFGQRCAAEKVTPWMATFTRELPEGVHNAARRTV